MTHAHDLLPILAPRMSNRSLRLYAVALARRPKVWGLLTDVRSREAVEVAERYAEGKATVDELDFCFRDAPADQSDDGEDRKIDIAWLCCCHARNGYADPAHSVGRIRDWLKNEATLVHPFAAELLWDVAGPEKPPVLCGREDIHPAFRDSVPDWYMPHMCHPWPYEGHPCQDILSWRDATIPALARRIYDDRDTSAVAFSILADALEEAGVPCTSLIVKACRGWRQCDGRCDGGRWAGRNLNAPGADVCPTCSGTGWLPTGGIHAARGSWTIDLTQGKR